MEPIVIKRGKKTYAFFSDRLEITKTDKLTHTIYYVDIEKITYNSRYDIRDFFYGLIPSGGLYNLRNVFVIDLKTPGSGLAIRLSKDDFEKIKDILSCVPIEVT